MTLVGAFNPDFGQVEVDLAVVNLDGVRDLLRGEAAVLTEGSQVFLRFGRSGASDYTTYFYPEPLLFYCGASAARRRQATGAFVDAPAATTILGAAKLVGRSHRWNLGVLEALTGREYAHRRGRSRREPDRAAHQLLRAAARQRDLDARGDRIPGDGHEPQPARANLEAAAAAGVLWAASTATSLSTAPRLGRVRRSLGQHALGQPDLRAGAARVPALLPAPRRAARRGRSGGHVAVGLERRLGLNKNSGNVTFNAGLWGISPGFEPNDLGLRDADRSRRRARAVLFRKLTPDRFTRSRQVAIAKWWTFNYGSESQGDGVQIASSAPAQLLEARPHARQVVEHLGRQAHARGTDRDPARNRDARAGVTSDVRREGSGRRLPVAQ